MEFYEVINNRKSIRNFKDTDICKEKLSRIIDAAMKSPSWKNETSYKFIIVDDKNKKEEIANSILNKTDKAANAVKEAPMVSIVVANPNASGNVEGRQYYLVDSAIAMEHFILAATNEGYGTCWIGAFDEDKIKEILNIPNDYKVVGMTPLGESTENPKSEDKKDVRDYVFLNKWDEAYTENI